MNLENEIAPNDLHLLDLQNNTACFYNYSNPDAIEFEFKIKPVSCLGEPQIYVFEAEITQPMREFFEQIDVKMDRSEIDESEIDEYEIDKYEKDESERDESEPKIHIVLVTDGTVGWVQYIECEWK